MSLTRQCSAGLRLIDKAAAVTGRIFMGCQHSSTLAVPILELPTTFKGPTALYEHRISTGELHPDENQRILVEQLHTFYHTLQEYRPPKSFGSGSRVIQKLFGAFGASGTVIHKPGREQIKKFTGSPLGLYLYGGVGCGKTMLMDLFFDSCGLERKLRVHFHPFMRDVHRRIHDVKHAMGAKNFNLNRSQPYDPIAPVAAEIGREIMLLCFDEFQASFLESGVALFSLI